MGASPFIVIDKMPPDVQKGRNTKQPLRLFNNMLYSHNIHIKKLSPGGIANSKKGRCPQLCPQMPPDVNGFLQTSMDNKKPAILVELRVPIYCRITPDLEMVAMQGLEPRTLRI